MDSFIVESKNRIVRYRADAQNLKLPIDEMCDPDGNPRRPITTPSVSLADDFARLQKVTSDNISDFRVILQQVKNRTDALNDKMKTYGDGRCANLDDWSTYLACDTDQLDLQMDIQITTELSDLQRNRADIWSYTVAALHCFSVPGKEALELRKNSVDLLDAYFQQTLHSANCLGKSTTVENFEAPGSPISCD